MTVLLFLLAWLGAGLATAWIVDMVRHPRRWWE